VLADESDPLPLTPDEEAAWRALARVLVALPRAMDADLLRRAQLSLSDYRVLMFLSEAPRRSLRMSELADLVQISFSGLTRLIERLERRDMVERVKADTDGRGNRAVLTDFGLERLREAWPDHLRSVRIMVMDHLQGFDLPALAKALNSMIDKNDMRGPITRQRSRPYQD
jgi:DNA-binding MarR family transcriptional regulator